jgi:hypothetical protein
MNTELFFIVHLDIALKMFDIEIGSRSSQVPTFVRNSSVKRRVWSETAPISAVIFFDAKCVPV